MSLISPSPEASTSTSSGDLENAGTAETMEMEQVESSCSTTGSMNEATIKCVDEPEEITVASSNDAETQTEEFEYMFYKPTYRAPDREYFKSDNKVRFYTGTAILPGPHCNIKSCGTARESTDSDTRSFPGICYCFDEATTQYAVSGSGLPIHGISNNCFPDILVVDKCHGQQVEWAPSLASERKPLEDNANELQVFVWQ